MKIILSIKINSPSNKEGLDFIKEFNSSIIPSIGTLIKDPVFAELKPIKKIVFDYTEDTCIVEIEAKEVPDANLGGHVQEVAEMHNWVLKSN